MTREGEPRRDSDVADIALVSRLKSRLERERKTRLAAEALAERVTRELYDLNRMKTDLLSTVSHEFRTPLTVIIGFAQSLKEQDLGNDPTLRAQFLNRIEESAGRLLRLVEEVLEASLLQRGQADLQVEPFDFRVLAEKVVAASRSREVTVRLEIPPALGPVESDPRLVGHVLTHLLDNAVKFTPPGGICTVGASGEGGALRFWVQDEGVGIDPQEIERIFEPFWQADTSETREFGGLGLGLYVVGLLTKAIGAHVHVESTVGRGTRFTVTLPSAPAPARAIRG